MTAGNFVQNDTSRSVCKITVAAYATCQLCKEGIVFNNSQNAINTQLAGADTVVVLLAKTTVLK